MWMCNVVYNNVTSFVIELSNFFPSNVHHLPRTETPREIMRKRASERTFGSRRAV